jgi:hypothetical protein
MKRIAALLITLTSLLSADSASDYVNFIRQIQSDSGVEWDVTIPSNGSRIAPTGVSVDGAFFQLWSIHNATVAEYLLDEQFVTAYTPNAKIEFLSLDPYGPVRRTRVDQPFQVRIEVNGLLLPSDLLYILAPDAAKWVDYTHVGFNYPAGAHSLAEIANPVGELIEEGYMEENADTTVTFGVTNLTGTDITQVEGEEVFTISAKADFGVSATILDSKRIQIWPVARATLTGLDATAYYEEVPPITMDLVDLYPASTTYVRTWPNADPSDVKTVSASYVIIEDSIPQDRRMVLNDLSQYFTQEGYYTIEVLHETPFGIDILYSGSLRMDRTIEVTGGIYTRD